MITSPDQYTFRPVLEPDLPLVHTWLSSSSVAQWCDPGQMMAWFEQWLSDARIQMQLVHTEGQPFAFVQSNVLRADCEPYDNLPDIARGLATFIGVPEMLGIGHGPRYIRQYTTALFEAGVSAVAIAPHPDNQRAIRAWLKVGFTDAGDTDSEIGPIKLMCLQSHLRGPTY